MLNLRYEENKIYVVRAIITLLIVMVVTTFTFANVSEAEAASYKKPKKVTKLSVQEEAYTSIDIKWKKQKNIKQNGKTYKVKYQVKYKKTGTKKWKTVTTKKNTYTIKNLKTDTKYNIKVRAYYNVNKKKVFGKFSRMVFAMTEEYGEKEVESFVILEGDVFSEGKAWIKGYDGEDEFIGVINIDGELLFKVDGAELTSVLYGELHHSNFEQGVASVKLENGGTVIVDSEGRIVAQSGVDFDYLLAAGGGYFIICKEPKGYQQGVRTYAIMNNEGELSYPWSEADVLGNGSWEYYHSGMFVSGSRLVNATTNQFFRYQYSGLIGLTDQYIYFNNRKVRDFITCDLQGNTVSELDFGWDEYSCYQMEGEYSYVMFDSADGKTRILKKYNAAGDIVMEKEIDCAIEAMSNFSEGLCAAHINGADGEYITLMDTEGNFMFEPVKYDKIWATYDIDLSDGLLKCEGEERGTINYIDMNGNKVITVEGDYRTVSNFNEGVACVNDPLIGCYYINKQGDWILW